MKGLLEETVALEVAVGRLLQFQMRAGQAIPLLLALAKGIMVAQEVVTIPQIFLVVVVAALLLSALMLQHLLLEQGGMERHLQFLVRL
jgi:hypothetical protein